MQAHLSKQVVRDPNILFTPLADILYITKALVENVEIVFIEVVMTKHLKRFRFLVVILFLPYIYLKGQF